MYGRLPFSDIDWSRYRLTRFRIAAGCSVLLAIAVVISVMQFSSSNENVLPGGAPVGGDYVAFYGAAIAANEGAAAEMYDYEAFEAQLQRVGPPLEEFRLTWQYPPTYFLIILPFAFLPFIPGYIAWTGGAMALYFATMRKIGFSWFFLFVILASPSAFQAVITGQNGYLTATLLALAALYPDRRPVLAGAAAAILTVKPQLGVLLPVAYLAAGCWRAFFTAAIGAVALVAATTGVFGADIWTAFLDGAGAASERLGAGLYPLYKMATPYAWFSYLGAPLPLAITLHGAFAVATIALIARIWRTMADAELRAAALCAGVFFVAPYGYYYEMIILALPVALLAKRGLERGWLRFEPVMVTAMVLLPIAMPGQDTGVGLSWGFPCVLLIAAGILRRIDHDHADVFAPIRRMAARVATRRANA